MDFQWVPVALLVLFRSLGFFLTSPLLARREVPGQIKLLCAIALTVILTRHLEFEDVRSQEQAPTKLGR